MIDVGIKVFENGQAGLAVKVIARGAANSKREQIYLDKLQPAIQQAILDAGAEVEKLGLGEGLTEAFMEAVQGKPAATPAPLGPNAVEIPMPAGAPQIPPLFSQFMEDLLKHLAVKAPSAPMREEFGNLVRDVWIQWAKEQNDPKPSWLTPWEGLAESDKEVDRRIGETVSKVCYQAAHELARRKCEAFMKRLLDFSRWAAEQRQLQLHGKN